MISACLSSSANAETVVLLSGQKVEGQIIEQTPLRVMMDAQGTIETFFIGEIDSIDGNKVDLPQAKAVETAIPDVKKKPVVVPLVVPYYKDEEDSLVNFMNLRKSIGLSPSLIPKQKVCMTPAGIHPTPVTASLAH